MRHAFQTSDGLRIAYDIDDFTDPWKEVQSIVLLHSMMGHARRFYQWVPALSRRFRVIRPDLRGHGGSDAPGPERPLTMDRLVDDLADLLDHLGIPRAHILGNSAGGYVAQKFAIRSPDRTLSLMLFGATPGLKGSGADAWIPRIKAEGLLNFLTVTIADRFPIERVDPGLVKWFLEETGKCDQDFICRWLELTCGEDWSNELGGIACPTLVVRPGGETVGSADRYDIMAQTIPDVEMLTYAGFPHNICDIVPERCIADVLAFLERRFPKAS